MKVLDDLVPEIGTADMLKILAPPGYEISPDRLAVVRDLDYYKALSEIIRTTSRQTLQSYFRWNIIYVYSKRLHQDYKKPLRRFENRRAGKPDEAMPERWRICFEEVDKELGYLLGSAFIQRAFPIQFKELGDSIIKDIKSVFSERLRKFDWMAESTKDAAARKGKVHSL
jgi:endothelin-converting enzyme